MTASIDLTPKQRETLRSHLRRFIPGVAVWAFGSRVQWNARPDSDLDLAIFSSPKQHRRVSALKEALDESDLPFLVDLHVWDELPERFQDVIRREYVVIQEGEKPEDRLEAPTEWRRTALGETVELLSGGTPSKGRPDYWGGAIPWVSAKDMKCFRIEDTEDHLTEAGAANATRVVPPGTVLVLVRGMTLLNDVPVCVAGKPMAFNQDVKALRPKPGVAPDYLPYLLLGTKERLFSLVDLAGHGTGRLNSDELKALDVVLPPIEEQRAIAHILGMLDDKIELNRKMNRTLDEIAQALFRAWFVNFEGQTDLVESELGPIPRGWRVESIGELVETLGGGTPSTKEPKYWEGGNLHWTTPRDLSGLESPVLLDTARKITEAGMAKISSGLLPEGTVLLSSRAPVGYTAIAQMPLAVNQGYIAIPPGGRLSSFYVLFWLRENLDRIKGRAGGTTFQEISKKNFRPMLAIEPPKEAQQLFDDVVARLFERIVLNERQSRTLADLRDTLLPKLISGEIRVPEAEEALEEAV